MAKQIISSDVSLDPMFITEINEQLRNELSKASTFKKQNSNETLELEEREKGRSMKEPERKDTQMEMMNGFDIQKNRDKEEKSDQEERKEERVGKGIDPKVKL